MRTLEKIEINKKIRLDKLNIVTNVSVMFNKNGGLHGENLSTVERLKMKEYLSIQSKAQMFLGFDEYERLLFIQNTLHNNLLIFLISSLMHSIIL
jgi:hypothetical protein